MPSCTIATAGCDQAINGTLIDPHQDISAAGTTITTARGAEYNVRLYCEDCEHLYAGCGKQLKLQVESFAGKGGRTYNMKRKSDEQTEWTTVKNGNIVSKCTLE